MMRMMRMMRMKNHLQNIVERRCLLKKPQRSMIEPVQKTKQDDDDDDGRKKKKTTKDHSSCLTKLFFLSCLIWIPFIQAHESNAFLQKDGVEERAPSYSETFFEPRIICPTQANRSSHLDVDVFSNQGAVHLSRICQKDARCGHLYAQISGRPSQPSTFVHLYRAFAQTASGFNLEHGEAFGLLVSTPLESFICNRTFDEALSFVWVLALQYAALDSALCAPNERFVITDPVLGIGACVCLPNRICHYRPPFSNTVLAFLFILTLLIISIIFLQVLSMFSRSFVSPQPSSSSSSSNVTAS